MVFRWSDGLWQCNIRQNLVKLWRSMSSYHFRIGHQQEISKCSNVMKWWIICDVCTSLFTQRNRGKRKECACDLTGIMGNVVLQNCRKHHIRTAFPEIMGCVSYACEADTWSAVILGGTGRGVTSVPPQGAVGAGAGGSPLTGWLLPVALDAQTHTAKRGHGLLMRNKHNVTPLSQHQAGMWARLDAFLMRRINLGKCTAEVEITWMSGKYAYCYVPEQIRLIQNIKPTFLASGMDLNTCAKPKWRH